MGRKTPVKAGPYTKFYLSRYQMIVTRIALPWQLLTSQINNNYTLRYLVHRGKKYEIFHFRDSDSSNVELDKPVGGVKCPSLIIQ